MSKIPFNKMSKAREAVERELAALDAQINCRRRRKELFDKGILEVKKEGDIMSLYYNHDIFITSWCVLDKKYTKYTISKVIRAVCNIVNTITRGY